MNWAAHEPSCMIASSNLLLPICFLVFSRLHCYIMFSVGLDRVACEGHLAGSSTTPVYHMKLQSSGFFLDVSIIPYPIAYLTDHNGTGRDIAEIQFEFTGCGAVSSCAWSGDDRSSGARTFRRRALSASVQATLKRAATSALTSPSCCLKTSMMTTAHEQAQIPRIEM